jgi:hypothetical protein
MLRDLAAVLAVVALALVFVWWLRGHPVSILVPVPTTTTTDLVHQSAQQAQRPGQVGEAVHPVVMRPAQRDQVALVIGATPAPR